MNIFCVDNCVARIRWRWFKISV